MKNVSYRSVQHLGWTNSFKENKEQCQFVHCQFVQQMHLNQSVQDHIGKGNVIILKCSLQQVSPVIAAEHWCLQPWKLFLQVNGPVH